MFIQKVQKILNAGILQTIEEAFVKKGLENWKDKLKGFGSDGASVNLGSRGGMATLIKRQCPHLVIVHCIAHRLELAANSAIKHHRIIKEIQDLLHFLYKHYQYSPSFQVPFSQKPALWFVECQQHQHVPHFQY
jgi:hypothetical protein